MNIYEERLIEAGIPQGYNGFKYMVWLLEHLNKNDVCNYSMGKIADMLSEEFSISPKVALNNIALLSERAWENDKTHCMFADNSYRPSVKEFVITLVMMCGRD